MPAKCADTVVIHQEAPQDLCIACRSTCRYPACAVGLGLLCTRSRSSQYRESVRAYPRERMPPFCDHTDSSFDARSFSTSSWHSSQNAPRLTHGFSQPDSTHFMPPDLVLIFHQAHMQSVSPHLRPLKSPAATANHSAIALRAPAYLPDAWSAVRSPRDTLSISSRNA